MPRPVLAWSLRRLAGVAYLAALLASAVAAASPLVPGVAPQMMTMATMDRAFEVSRYEDVGRCDFWVVNMSKPDERIERSFDCGFFWDWSAHEAGVAYVHEALVDHGTGRVFEVPEMERGRLEEWYHVDAHMLTPDALRFRLPGAGVLMPPPDAAGALVMGWVESGGELGGEQRLVFPRALAETAREEAAGVPTLKWESRFAREPVQWHGYDVFLTEEVTLWSDPRTAWILQMERHVLVEMTPAQMAAVLGVAAPSQAEGVGPLHEPRPVMELTYRTVDAGVAKHREETLFFQSLVAWIHRAPGLVRPALGVTVVAAVAGLSLQIAAHRLRRPEAA